MARRRYDPKLLLKFVEPDYLRAIGLVITQWSIMEAMLDGCIWQAGRFRNDFGRVVSAQLQVLSKLDTLTSLLSQTNPQFAEAALKVATYVRECLNGKRNVVAHGMWHASEFLGTGFVVKFSARGKLADQGGNMTVAELEGLAHNIAEVTAWLMHLSNRLPKQRLRRGGLGHATPNTQNRRDCATRKLNALQPLPPRPRGSKRARALAAALLAHRP